MSEWISVKDRLPDDDENYYEAVLVYCVYGGCKECDVAYLTTTKNWLDEKCNAQIPVTHWMPLPEPPKDQS